MHVSLICIITTTFGLSKIIVAIVAGTAFVRLDLRTACFERWERFVVRVVYVVLGGVFVRSKE